MTTYKEAGRSVECAHCGNADLEQRFWSTAAAGMGLASKDASRLVKHGAGSVRFLACAECGLVQAFVPDANRGPDFAE